MRAESQQSGTGKTTSLQLDSIACVHLSLIPEFAKVYGATFPIAHDPAGEIRRVYQSLGQL